MIIVYHPAVSFSSNILGKCRSLNIFFSRTVFSSFPNRLRNISSVCAEFFAFSSEQSPGVMTPVFEYLAFSVVRARKGAFPIRIFRLFFHANPRVSQHFIKYRNFPIIFPFLAIPYFRLLLQILARFFASPSPPAAPGLQVLVKPQEVQEVRRNCALLLLQYRHKAKGAKSDVIHRLFRCSYPFQHVLHPLYLTADYLLLRPYHLYSLILARHISLLPRHSSAFRQKTARTEYLCGRSVCR